MNPTSVIALFCDDIRVEQSGALSLVGVYSDNVKVPDPPPAADGRKLPLVIPRLGVYVRVNFDVRSEIGPINVKVTMPDGEVIHDEMIEEKTIAEGRATKKKGNPVAGLIQRLQFGNLPVTLGRIVCEVTIGTQTYLAGFLNFTANET
jgi:hypothetical protein